MSTPARVTRRSAFDSVKPSLASSPSENPAISGVVLEDFDSVFVNKFYHSILMIYVSYSMLLALLSFSCSSYP
ncbi:hypothetical protein GmHk_10G029334 [Glycine max]|nr:hypothetical protein GmHk_10G029334 [Glycine max]